MGAVRHVAVSAVAAVIGAYLAVLTLLSGGLGLWPPGTGSTSVTQSSWIASVHQHTRAIRSSTQEPQQARNESLSPPERMIITGRWQEDVSWIPLKLGTIPSTVYQFVENLTDHNLVCPPGVSNVQRPGYCPDRATKLGGRESIVYLDYIVNNYDRLPDKMLFIHPHELAWHRDNIVNNFHRLKWDAFQFANIRHWRFVNWHCGNGHYPPCGCVLTLMITPLDPEAARSPLLNDGQSARDWAPHQSRCLYDFWGQLFQAEFGDIPERVMEPACCGEFLVTRDRVQLRNLSFYENALRVVSEMTDAGLGHPVGVAMESMWHVIFGEPYISQAVYKCDLLECSDEEAADPLLVPPPILDPFVLYHLKGNATSAADRATLPEDVTKAEQ